MSNVMMNLLSAYRYLLVFCVSLSLVACAPKVGYRGKHPGAQELSQITQGVSTKEDVLRLIGSPSFEALHGSPEWVYVYNKEQTRSFLEPSLTDASIVRVTFDDSGVVRNLSRDSYDSTLIDPIKYKTPTVGQDQPLLQQVFSNFGRFARQGKE